MKCLINIVHPYTYKLEGDTVFIGPFPEFEKRDRKIVSFIRKYLDLGHQVLHHRDKNPKHIDGALRDILFLNDPIYGGLFQDPRMDFVVTTPLGQPIPDNRPEAIKLKNWENYVTYFTTDSGFKNKIKEHDINIFIGGCLDACLANAMGYYHENIRKPGEKMYYVLELSTIYDNSKLYDVTKKLIERNIFNLNYEEAMSLI